jgi:hypothetical protein
MLMNSVRVAPNVRAEPNFLSPLRRGRLAIQTLDGSVQQTQRAAVDAVQELVQRERIKERIIEEAQHYAQLIADHQNDPDSQPDLQDFPAVPIDEEDGQLGYFLVLDFLESIGMKLAPTVFRYESQYPDIFVNRSEVAQRLQLRSYDRTPLLVQLIEEKRRSLAQSDSN